MARREFSLTEASAPGTRSCLRAACRDQPGFVAGFLGDGSQGHSSTRRAMAGGWRPARSQPVRAAAAGTPRMVMVRPPSCYGVFMIVERTARTPLMHPNLLSRRPIAAGAFLIFIAAGVLIADLFLGSQYLQHLRGLSALETGVFFLPAALALMIGAIAAGRLVGTVGTRPVAVVGLALVAIGNGLLVGVPAGENVGC